MNVRDIMSAPPIVAHENASLADAAELMLTRRIGGLPVVDDRGRLVGFLTDSDFAAKEHGIPFSTFRAPQVLGAWLPEASVEKVYSAARAKPVRDFMCTNVHTIGEDETVEAALRLMLEHDVNRLPVVRDGRPVGVIARHDILKMLTGTSSDPGDGATPDASDRPGA